MVKLTKNKQALLDYLGKDYEAKNIDMEACIYRDFGDYDIEVSGGHLKNKKVIIFLWDKRDGFHVIETAEIENGDFESVKNELDKLIQKHIQ